MLGLICRCSKPAENLELVVITAKDCSTKYWHEGKLITNQRYLYCFTFLMAHLIKYFLFALFVLLKK